MHNKNYSIVNYSFTKTDFLDNEAENMHTENAVELAMMFGTEEEQKRMNMIMTAHNTRGYILTMNKKNVTH